MRIASEKTIHRYGDLEQTIKVEGDMPNLVLAVPEAQNQAAAHNKAKRDKPIGLSRHISTHYARPQPLL